MFSGVVEKLRGILSEIFERVFCGDTTWGNVEWTNRVMIIFVRDFDEAFLL
jgi:hypothetical protein